MVKELQLNGVKVLASINSQIEAQTALATGIDGLIIQGCTAGGHQAGFAHERQNPLSTLELLQQVRALDRDVVLIATGGIEVSDIHAYLNEHGVDYVQLGTLFMLSELSTLNSSLREFIASKSSSDISMSSAITGKSVRGINNQLMRELDVAEYPFPIQHYASSYLRAKTKSLGQFEYAGDLVREHQSYQALRFDDLINDIKNNFNKKRKILMVIYPAIDLRDGKCVRLYKGDFAMTKIYNDNPAAMLEEFATAGSEWVHMVDLDGAKAGKFTQGS